MSMGKENNDMEVNYEALLEAALKKIKSTIDIENEYFDCLSRVSAYENDVSIVSKHIMEMSMSDQLLLLKSVISQGEISKALQEKYRFEEDTE